MAKFEAKRFDLRETVTIEAYVPNRDGQGRLIHNHEHWVRLVEASLCELTGGACTTYEARGRWAGAYEHTSVVRAAVPADSDLAGLHEALGVFGEETAQAVAGYTRDGVWYGVGRAGGEA